MLSYRYFQKKKTQHSMLANIDKKKTSLTFFTKNDFQQLCWQYGCLSSVHYWLWYFLKLLPTFNIIFPKHFFIYKQLQENSINNCVWIFGDLQQFSQYNIYWSYSQHRMPDLPCIFSRMFYTSTKRKFCQYLCRIFVPIFLFSCLFWQNKIFNIQC